MKFRLGESDSQHFSEQLANFREHKLHNKVGNTHFDMTRLEKGHFSGQYLNICVYFSPDGVRSVVRLWLCAFAKLVFMETFWSSAAPD